MRKPDRNAPCPCGSGKKYKKCCYLRSLPAAGEELSLRSEIVREVLAFSRQQFPETVEGAYDQFWAGFDPREKLEDEALELAEINFWEWFIHDYQVPEEGYMTPIELYEKGGGRLDPERIAVLEKMRKSVLSLYEVAEVLPEKGLLLNDLFLGGTYAVREKLGTSGIGKWDILAVRLIFLDDVYAISGAIYSFPRPARAALLKQLVALYNKYRTGAPDGSRADFLKLFGDYFNRSWCVQMMHPFNPKLANRDGEAFVLCTATFQIEDRIAAIEKLRSLEALEEDDARTFVWLGERLDDDSSLIRGTIRLRERSLTLECNSRERLETGKALLLECLGNLIRHKADVFQDPYQAMKEHRASGRRIESGIPREVEQQLRDKYIRQHYEKWGDEKLPALGGKTPREAVKTPSGKKKVVDLLKQIENAEEHAKLNGEAFSDLSWLWERLGLGRDE
jgi:hypothetical protein